MAAVAYSELTKVFSRLHKFSHASSILMWDQMANMPSGGAQARAAAKAELELLRHDILCSAETAAKLKAVEDAKDSLSPEQLANLREIKRVISGETQIPADLVEKLSLAKSKANTVWATNRPKNDWVAFVPALEEVVALTREQAKLLATGTSMTPYEALMDKFEPGLTVATVNKTFDDLKCWLPELVTQCVAKQETLPQVVKPEGPFDVKAQEALGLEVMKELLNFNFDGGMLSVSKHPFCGGVPEDVRLTTRYTPDDFDQSLYGIIHETGHARYEQNRPRDVIDQPVSAARSAGIHESQSLFVEKQIGRSKTFQEQWVPLLKKFFPENAHNVEKSFTSENMYLFHTTVKPSLIRTDADEVTYPLHVILRYEIEVALIDGDLQVKDIPAQWDLKMKEYLGIDTTGNFKDGPMQDIHWGMGYFGYFPTYTIGAIYAAQWMVAAKKELGEDTVTSYIAQGKMEPIFQFLKEKVWIKGSSLPTGEDLMKEATGEGLNVEMFRGHLTARYLDKTW